MKFFLSILSIFLAVSFIQGRSYGYRKKKIVKKPVIIPEHKLPLCRPGCTRQWISPECREETYGFENGVKCKGCDRDICRGDNLGLDRWQNGDNWQPSGNIGGDRLHNGQDWQPRVNIGGDRWQNRQNWQSGGNWRGDGFPNQGQNGFSDSFQNNDFLNQGQGGFVNGRNNFDNFQNGQLGNQW